MFKNLILSLLGTAIGVGMFFIWPRDEINLPIKEAVFVQNVNLDELSDKLKKIKQFSYQFKNASTDILEEGSIYQYKNETKDYERLKKTLGWLSPEYSVQRMRKTKASTTIFDEIYTNGKLGFRKTDLAMGAKHFIFLGGSNTYGIGVDDKNTLPYLFGKENPKYSIYNLGVQAFGPSHGLSLLENYNLRSIVKETDGVMLYYFFPFLINRIKGSSSYLEMTSGESPEYRVNNEFVEYVGSFKNSLKYKILKLCFRSEILMRGVAALEQIQTKDLILAAKVFSKIKSLYLKAYPKGEFLIYIPNFYGWKNMKWRGEFLKLLDQEGVSYKEGGEVYNNDYLFEDHHLTPKAHELNAIELKGLFN